MWTTLTIAAAVSLVVYFFRGRNAVWGGLTIGPIGGLVWSLVSGHGFNWLTIGRGAVLGALIGVGAELLSKIGKLFFRRTRNTPIK